MTDHATTDTTDPTDHATTETTRQDDGLQRRRQVLVALGAGTAAWALPSITTSSRSAAATGSTATTPTVPDEPTTSTTTNTTTTTQPATTTTTEAPTTTTTTSPSGLVLDHDVTASYGTVPVAVGGLSVEAWQEIAPTFSGVLSRIVLHGGAVGSPLTVNVHRIRTVGAFPFPDGPSLGGASIPAPTTAGFASRTFDLSVPVEAGTRYLLVFAATTEGPSYGWNLSFGNAVPGLVAYRKFSHEFYPQGLGTLVFRTYLLPS